MASKSVESFQKIAVAIMMGFVILILLSGLYGIIIAITKLEISTIITILTAFIAVVALSALVISALKKNPSLLIISLIGYPSCGKTVYISVLFREFITRKISNISFLPYGLETNEQIAHNWNLLTSGKWLPPTKNDEKFPYSAVASVGQGLFADRYTIQMRDFAGENISIFNTNNELIREERWLHKSKYFKNFAESDVIFLAIDGQEILDALISKDNHKIAETENSMIAALNMVREYKSVSIGNKMRIPVGIIFMKWDLITNYTNKLTEKSADSEEQFSLISSSKELNQYMNLITFCKNNCKNFEIFYVSSIGYLAEGGLPPTELAPINVTTPIEWALKIKTTE
jgi:hypothetical protein